MYLRPSALLTLVLSVLVAAPGYADASECEWKETPVQRGECFLEEGKDSLSLGDSDVASKHFLEGLRWIDDEYLSPPTSESSASKLLTKAALAARSGDSKGAAVLRMRVLDDAIRRAMDQ